MNKSNVTFASRSHDWKEVRLLDPPISFVNAEELVSKHIVSVKTKIPAERQTRAEEIAIYRRC